MARRKTKVVFTADPAQIERIQAVIRAGGFRTASEFLRNAIDEKLARLCEEDLAAQVSRYCRRGLASDAAELIDAQAFDFED